MKLSHLFFAALLGVAGLSACSKDNSLPAESMISNNVAMFIPEGYDSDALPSLILKEEPNPVGAIPAERFLRPIFTRDSMGQKVTFRLPAGVSLYGGGEVTGPLLRNGMDITVWASDAPAYELDGGRRLYQAHPWVMGVRDDGASFGIIFDTVNRGELLTANDSIVFSAVGSPYRVFVIEGDTPQDVVKTLGTMTGTISMPPRWALGYHQCRFSYYPDSTVRSIADNFRGRHIPCDAIWFDIHYMDGYRIFTIDEELFPDPKGLNDYLHSEGFKTVYMIDPGVKVDSAYHVYASGRAGDVFVKTPASEEYHGDVWPGACAFPDYTRPEVRQWWGDLYADFLSFGIDGIWNDMNEPTIFGGPDSSMPGEMLHEGGDGLPAGNHSLYHNAFGRLMVQASYEGILRARPDKRPFVLSRSNLLGGQRYAATWTGDNSGTEEHMRLSIPMTLTLGLSGQPFNGPDLGGFYEDTPPKLFGHWMGMGAFFPFARGHASRKAYNKEPWVLGEEVEKESRIALQRRYRLLPYYYTLFHESHISGLPVMQPVFFADPADADLRAEQEAFLVGADLLVVPAFSTDAALPKGNWREFSLVEGDRTGRFQASLRLRPGAILPVGAMIENTEQDSMKQLTLIVNPDDEGNARGELYWDSGDGWEFQNGEYAKLAFEASTDAEGTLVVELSNREGNYPVNLEAIEIETLTGQRARFQRR